MRPVAVYELRDVNGAPRYVGRSCCPGRRLLGHLAAREDTHRDRWVRSLKAAGQKPSLVVLVWCDEQESRRIEAARIVQLRADGAALTNATPGGDGQRPCAALTSEQAQRKAASIRAAWTPERRAQHSRRCREVAARPDVKERHARAMASQDVKAALSVATRARWARTPRRVKVPKPGWTPERRAAHSARLIAFWLKNQNRRAEYSQARQGINSRQVAL